MPSRSARVPWSSVAPNAQTGWPTQLGLRHDLSSKPVVEPKLCNLLPCHHQRIPLVILGSWWGVLISLQETLLPAIWLNVFRSCCVWDLLVVFVVSDVEARGHTNNNVMMNVLYLFRFLLLELFPACIIINNCTKMHPVQPVFLPCSTTSSEEEYSINFTNIIPLLHWFQFMSLDQFLSEKEHLVVYNSGYNYDWNLIWTLKSVHDSRVWYNEHTRIHFY